MPSVRSLLICIVLVSLSGCASTRGSDSFPAASAASVGLDQSELDGLVALAQGFVDADRILGAEILIIKDRRTVVHETVGWSDREEGVAIERGSFYRIRSMTKPFTGTASMMLIDDGRLRLDSRPAEFFPSWDNERSRGVTVEQLLAHQSGFEQGGWPRETAGYDTLGAIVDACGELGPTQTVGERFIYSDVNSFTLGALVSHITGMPFEKYVQRYILDPLGLGEIHTAYSPEVAWADRMNPTYRRSEDGDSWEMYWHPERAQEVAYFRASGGLYSTTTAYAKWLACWMDGTVFDSDTGARLVSAGLVDAALRVHGADDDGAYGYHWELYPDGFFAFGHGGSDGTLAIAVPSEDLIVLYFTQSRFHDTREEWRSALWDVVGAE